MISKQFAYTLIGGYDDEVFYEYPFWIFKKTIFGFVALYAFNFVGSFIGISLASSYLSYFLIGSLGLPGLLVVYMANLLFG